MPSLFKKHPFAVVLSVIAHVLLVGFFVFGLDFSDTKMNPAPPVNTVKATVIDGAKIKAEADKLKKREAKKKLEEKQRQQRLEKQRKAEQKKIDDLKKQQQNEKKKLATQKAKQKVDEAARLAKLKKQKAEAKKKKERDVKKKAVAKKKAAAKKLADAKKKKLADQKRKRLAAEKRKKEQAVRDQRAREQTARDAMAREEQEMRAQEALASYSGAIRQKVERNWIQPAGGMEGLSCTVRVRLIPGGEVIDAQVIRSSGNALFDRSVELATRKASPLPLPEDPSLFDYFRTIEFTFDPGTN